MGLTVRLSRVRHGDSTVLTDVAFTAESGEMIAVIGKNGAGKSTLLSALASLLPYQGEVCLDGVPLASLSQAERAARVAVMPTPLHSPHITVKELLYLGCYPQHSLFSLRKDTDEARVLSAMSLAALDALADAYLDRISAGERMRAELGRLLVQDAPLFLLDEPTAYMDPEKAVSLLRLCKGLCRERGKTVIAATHDLSSALRFADRILLIHEGKGEWFCTPQALLSSNRIAEIFSLSHTLSEDGFPLFYPV